VIKVLRDPQWLLTAGKMPTWTPLADFFGEGPSPMLHWGNPATSERIERTKPFGVRTAPSVPLLQVMLYTGSDQPSHTSCFGVTNVLEGSI
jgi:hypothetical protein